LRLQCGMPCSKLEVSTVQHGTLSGAGYLHQSRQVALMAASVSAVIVDRDHRRSSPTTLARDAERVAGGEPLPPTS
jgi:hypothetical protein